MSGQPHHTADIRADWGLMANNHVQPTSKDTHNPTDMSGYGAPYSDTSSSAPSSHPSSPHSHPTSVSGTVVHELETVDIEDTVEDLPSAIEKWGQFSGAVNARAVRRAAKSLWSEQHVAVDTLQRVVAGTHAVKESDIAVVLQASPFVRFLLTIDEDAVCDNPQLSQSVLSAPVDPQLTGRELRLQTLALANLRRECGPSRAYLPAAVVEDLRVPAANVVSWTRLPPSNAIPEFLSAEEKGAAVDAALSLIQTAHGAGFRLSTVVPLVPAWEEHTAQFGGTTAEEATAHIVAFFKQQSALLAEASAESTEVPAWLGWDGSSPVLAPPADVMFPATELRWSPPGPLDATADDDEIDSPPLVEFTTAGCIGPAPRDHGAVKAAASYFAQHDTAAALRCIERIAEGAQMMPRTEGR